MDRTQSRWILAMAAVLVVLSVVLLQQGETPVEADPEATEPVWSVEIDEIAAVTVERESGRLVLEREGETWFVREPFSSRADDDQVHDLLDDLREIRRGIPVEAPAERAGEFGLGEPPHARVTVAVEGGEERRLDVGMPAPTGFRTYARSAAGGVVAVNGDPNRSLQAEPRRFQDHHVFRFDAGAVRRVRIVGPDGTLDVHGRSLDWWLEGFTRADPDKVDDLVVGLLDLRFDTILDLDQHVEDPIYDVTIELEGGDVRWLRTGDRTPMGVLVETADGRTGMVPPEALAQLGRGPRDVGSLKAFGIRMDASEVVTVSVPGRALEARRNGPAWEAEGIGEGEVWDVVQALADVPVAYSVQPAPPLGERWGEVVVTDGDRVQHVILGSTLVDGFRIALDQDGGAPFRVPADALDAALEGLPSGQ